MATGLLAGQTITVAGQARTYVLSVPADYTAATPLALVLAWHGANIDGALAQRLFNLESKSNGAAIFAYPDGLAPAGWDLSSGSADFQLFLALVDSISSSYCIDANRIFATGHSSGAVMANDLGCYYGDMLRAVAPASGTPPSLAGRPGCTGKVAAIVMHGENDSSFSQGQATRDFWLKQNGCGTQTATWAPEPDCIEYRGCQYDLPVVWCIHDGGHAWPSLSYGCDVDGGICFDGGSAVWAFFSHFR
jgi:polyhydroxybutyrate depolymerase